MRKVRAIAALSAVLAAACSKTTPAPGGGADSASITTEAPAASSAAPAASAAPSAPATFAGTYNAEPATIYIPEDKDWKGTKQAKDDPSKLVGEGTITLTVDPSGHVEGTIDSGPAAPAIVSGKVEGETIYATVQRKDPSDEGLYGTATGTMKGKTVEGVLKLSDARAALVREAKFTAEKK